MFVGSYNYGEHHELSTEVCYCDCITASVLLDTRCVVVTLVGGLELFLPQVGRSGRSCSRPALRWWVWWEETLWTLDPEVQNAADLTTALRSVSRSYEKSNSLTFLKTAGFGRGGPKGGTSSRAVTETCQSEQLLLSLVERNRHICVWSPPTPTHPAISNNAEMLPLLSKERRCLWCEASSPLSS